MTFARRILCLSLGIGFAAGIVLLGSAVIRAQDAAKSEKSETQPASWSQEQWPFPIDQWGTGQAFRCAAERCGRELHVYVRAKVGFCRCATGVSDDDEIERVGDLELIGTDYQPLTVGHPVTAGVMAGRARLYSVARPLQAALPVMTIALAHKCDAIVATVRAEPQAEAQALELLRSAAVQHWVESQGGLP
jgi:hypothetical protein